MVVTILVQVVATVKKLFNFIDFLFRVADLIIDNPSSSHNTIMVEGVVSNVSLLSITAHIIKLIHVDSIS